MSTELKSRSKAYDLTRVGIGNGNVGVVVSQQKGSGRLTLSIPDIEEMFTTDNFSILSFMLDLLDETVERLKLDLAQFALSKGDGMTAF